MKKLLSLLVFVVIFAAKPVQGQTLFQEGHGMFFTTAPVGAALPTGEVAYGLNGSYAYRLTEQINASLSFSYSSGSVRTSAGLGHTFTFSESEWGLRSGLSLRPADQWYEYWNLSDMRAIVGTKLFRQVSLVESVRAYPSLGVHSNIRPLTRDAIVGVYASVRVPVYVNIWRNASVFVAPSYDAYIYPSFRAEEVVTLGLGAQLAF